MGFVIEFVCPQCAQRFSAEAVQTYCQRCQSPILARYDLEQMARSVTPPVIRQRKRGLWRWEEFLPVKDRQWQISLGEGDTPLLPLPSLGKKLGLRHLYLKDEAQNPTACFKARGLAVTLSRHLELGLRHFRLATAGNAGGALAAYAARASAQLRQAGQVCIAHIYMPRSAPLANRIEVQWSGADLHLVDGLISDAAQQAAQDAQPYEGTPQSWFDLSTFKEPYRVEGKKTMGLELAEQFDYQLPDVILYPTGGGTGLIGMWKAFDELEQMGWIDTKRPRMISVQASGCAPIVQAFEAGAERAQAWQNAFTLATGLCVPKPFADRLILNVIRQSNGAALAVEDQEIQLAQQELAQLEGIFAAPEGAATLAALKKMVENRQISSEEKVVLFNTASGVKYIW
ncbi:MAG: threonine synthase [Anaerolineae bacterium]|jgi:threonine synthase|nr:MAG: threonine synthase [Anaerolineae bacterium]